MKLNLSNVKELKHKTNNKLTKNVCDYIIEEWNNYDDKKCIFTDVLHYGCQPGMVAGLIYYSDTVAFYKKYQNEISELLYNLTADCGITDMTMLFGDKWDKEDPLAFDAFNQNLLAWFGFEETLRNIAYEFKELRDCI